MSLECKCDECNKYIGSSETTICHKCFDALKDDIRSLEERIDVLEKQA